MVLTYVCVCVEGGGGGGGGGGDLQILQLTNSSTHEIWLFSSLIALNFNSLRLSDAYMCQ